MPEDPKKLSGEEIKNIFVATVSHQLRTPLSVVKWVLSVLATDQDLQKKENSMQLIKQASAGVDRMVDTVNDLINLVRIDEGKLPITFREDDITRIVNLIIERVKAIAESKEISLTVNLEAQPKPFLFDSILATEVLENLLTNAIDYCDEKGAITVTLTQPSETMVEVVVTNTGPGLTEAELTHVFDPFFRGEAARVAHPDGSGLGLYLSKSIMEAHDGTITFASVPGKETVVTIGFPTDKSEPTD